MYIEDDGFSNAYKKICLYLLKNGGKKVVLEIWVHKKLKEL